MIIKSTIIILSAFLLINLSTDLMDIAERTANKTVEYSNDIDLATECAFRGVEVKYCTPDLVSDDNLETERRDFLNLLENLSDMNVVIKEGKYFTLKKDKYEYILKTLKVLDGAVRARGFRTSTMELTPGFQISKDNPVMIDIDEDGMDDVEVAVIRTYSDTVEYNLDITDDNIVISLAWGGVINFLLIGLLLGMAGFHVWSKKIYSDVNMNNVSEWRYKDMFSIELLDKKFDRIYLKLKNHVNKNDVMLVLEDNYFSIVRNSQTGAKAIGISYYVVMNAVERVMDDIKKMDNST